MTAAAYEKNRTPSLVLVRRLFRGHLRRHMGRIILAVLCMAAAAGAMAGMIYLVQPILDRIFVARDSEALPWIASAVLALFLFRGMANYGQAVLMSQVGQKLIASLQIELFAHLIHADLAFHQDQSSGKLISRFVSDINLLRMSVTATISGFGRDLLTLVALVIVMFEQDWLLASIAFFAFPTAVLPILKIGRHIRHVSRATQVQMSRLAGRLSESFQGARHVKAYSMEEYEINRARRDIQEVRRLIMKATRSRAALQPILEGLSGIAVVAIIIYGGIQVIEGVRTQGELFSFLMAMFAAYEPMKKLATWNAQVQEGLAAADRVYEVLDIKPRIVDASDAKPLSLGAGAIVFRGVRFSYVEGREALRGIDLMIPGGKTVALVGPSGAGKSTLLNLIPRFYDVTVGSLTIDGQEVRGVTLASLRGAIGLVSQEIVLFDDTIRANIVYGRPDASDAEMIEAAKAAGAHEFVSGLPEGYDSLIGPHGVKLSGGQRQRIVIARAMLKNAPILLLDEATSALDTESERHVQAAIARLKHGRTTVMVAHRLSTIIDADLIYVLEDGTVAEQGTHDELLALGGLYARLHALQFAGEGEGLAEAELERTGTPIRANEARARA